MKTYGILVPLLLAGCNAVPLEYSKTGDMKSGPGMFTGASGSFGMSKEVAPAAAQPAAVKPVAPAISAEEYREFQDWREWKRQREQAGKQ
jgi:hypothetical protein